MNAFKYQRDSSLYSVQRQISDGNLEVVTVRVPYEDKATLHVLVDDVQITSSPVQGSPYTWQWDSDTIRITPKVASGSQVLVRRVSPADAMKNIFNGQAEFTDESMDENFKQLLWLAQEYGEGSGLHDVFSNINMHGYKITNVGRATDDDDVVTFGQYKDDALGAWQAAQQAKEALQQGKQILDRAQTVADALEQTNAQITQKWQQTEQQIDTAISEMNSTVQSGKQTIEYLKNSTIQQINDAKSQIGENITQSAESAELAKNWATKLGSTVDGKEYSSKYYAQASKAQAVKSATSASASQSSRKASETARVGAQEALASAQAVIPQVTAEGTKQVNRVMAQGNTQVQAVGSAKGSALQELQNALESHEATLQQVGSQEVQKVKQQGATSVSAVTAEGTKQVQVVATQGTTQINLAKAQVDLVKAEVTKATEQATAAQGSAATATQKASQASASASAAKTSETNAASSASTATAQAGVATKQATSATQSAGTAKSQADRAKAEADRAEQYANDLQVGQVQADWNQTNPQEKSYIKNKPTLATVATTGNYSDLIGVPEIPDPTWQNIQNKPSDYPPSTHTHVKSQITDFAHSHAISEITNLQTTLNGKQPVGDYATNTALTQGLAGKQPVGDYATNTALTQGLAGKLGKTQKAESATLADRATVADSATTAGTANSVAWNNVSGKPGTFPPSAHKHSTSQITGIDGYVTKSELQEAIKSSAGLPMGHHYAWPFKTIPANSIQCNGATYDRTLYADFFAYATQQGWVKTESEWQSIASSNGGYCPWYSDGDGSTNFRTPKFAPFMQIAIASSNVGNYHEAGLPNITGGGLWWEDHSDKDSQLTGAFYISSDPKNNMGSGKTDHNNGVVNFDASRESAKYGKSDTVQPESNEWMICVVVLGIATNVGSADISNVMSAVAQVQADVSSKLPNTTPHIVDTWKSGSNWYRIWSDGFIEQAGYVNTPSDGEQTISLNTSFSTTTYWATVNLKWKGSTGSGWGYIHIKTRTSFKGTMPSPANYWYACGY